MPTVYTATTLEDAIASHTSYSGGKVLYNYPAIGTPLPTLQDAIAAHFVEGGYLEQGDLRQDEVSPKVQKVFRDGRLLIIKDGVTYDAWGHIVDMR